MMVTTHLQGLWGWFMIGFPTLVIIISYNNYVHGGPSQLVRELSVVGPALSGLAYLAHGDNSGERTYLRSADSSPVSHQVS